MANTTWNPSDKAAGITLSGGNLIATNSSGALCTVRAIDRQVSGKFYWECACSIPGAALSGVGLAWQAAALNASIVDTNTRGVVGVARSGQISVDGTNVGSVGAGISGGTVCIAVDLTARLVWFRLGAAGNWNNNVANNPATSVGGITITELGVGIPAYPAASLAQTSDAVTANFGDTAFTGTVPSGFTSGFTAGATINTNALATQVAAEHWLTTNPDAQITQIALEHWATVTGTGQQAVVTQVALEHWASVREVSLGGPMVTIIG